MQPYSLALVLGTAREGRASEGVAHFLIKEVERSGLFTPTLVDVRGYPQVRTARVTQKAEGSLAHRWSAIAREAFAFVFVVPEYNRGYPGEFKLLLDALHDEYTHKPALICGVSNGKYGGVRVAEHLKPVLVDLGLVVLPKALPVSEAPTFFEEPRRAEREAFAELAQKSLRELAWFAKRLASS